ncbi:MULTISPECIES: DNA oxidative demethylase AlkB [unclassified Bradyrhizobium]|uniref:DNA oxidative demethylase AlkB n=1 Tax=unclassified Bradyrhizobium TaxID=2631580 RepID=UPI001BA59356|nr:MULTISPECIES: DNA oxidative demethylase AlkB [unclassified Bradyrhizobium]MBR1202213.1 DNA oxidative demethylase AlkB [Bradyrhizobium sp. AUGA SZCCT0124]MBR1311218.1 DNA oxidative demethylase AlkB [Bradyrhizobium sp. AUGA SZCCT0051]MBR1339162.1 DNA oxidative demethylase AlkB [Bradyrhizobium sp. AUGA SZCCT0105]MBR1353736.1 DNA oxidative demethylase AlkB [Bradyrhizobium sp. AUGA SZCCT0045]
MAADLFETIGDARPPREVIADGAVLLRGFVRPFEAELIPALRVIVKQAPFRHLITPGGHRMSVAMTNCGSVGWVSDSNGYRYDPIDPDSGQPWPEMPEALRGLAAEAAAAAGFNGFAPEACLINRYVPGAKLSLHQDKDELDYGAPIVSISLGLPAVFLFGGLKRSNTPRRYRLEHGDVAVWGGPSRLFYHGVAALADGEHSVLGRQRINLTFRKVR